MEEKTLLTIAVICAILGIIVLFFISGSLEVKESSITKISDGESEGEAVLKGTINRFTETEKVVILDLTVQEDITVVMFKQDNAPIVLKKGEKIEVRGRTEEYEGRQEIIAEEARVVG